MHKHINFEDNIFVLNTRIRMIRDSLILDTDPELFLEKTVDDTNFIDLTLANYPQGRQRRGTAAA
jgi:hypothetical protein